MFALRNGRPTDPNLIATRLRDTPARLYATPSYLKRIGHPKTPADLLAYAEELKSAKSPLGLLTRMPLAAE